MINVVCGIKNHAIVAFDPMRIDDDPQNVTKQAIEAVRDYMFTDINKGETSVGYQWKRNGKLMKLVLCVED